MSTGLIKGRVQDDKSCYGIHLAEVKNSTGGCGMSLVLVGYGLCGDYWIDAPAGESTVTATAAGYTDEIIHNVTVRRGKVTWVNFTMRRE
ncbi:MAG: carboxypeptidase-like regulatory domain-containing protein [Deltaproteobacteria bacterium]|nr:carboxypeptidase-like regulatory domain-containing protein [Deltaproteobacteria bacterium]